ncbi:hypothetical protein SPF06_09065 [Sinomonas sp. JGH33]|uniref:Uncharacterized protein n=1 Tax=Sinomonas terricola TaxID=3110330 RepID=A0ABU5T5F1_9MICC|nr:hypothetical protein [Sinomonas sp. JGH33]MEA5454870.1 hypothetical protein [Sinomonas sp. JGH33]
MRRSKELLAVWSRAGRTALRAAFISLLGIMLPAGTLFAAGTAAKPDFSVQTWPAGRSVAPGSSAVYSITITSQNGFAGTVTMSVSSLPSASTAAFSPASVNVTAWGKAYSTLKVSTTTSTQAGPYALRIQGTSRKASISATAGLTVSDRLSASSPPAFPSIAPGSGGTPGITRTMMSGRSPSASPGWP